MRCSTKYVGFAVHQATTIAGPTHKAFIRPKLCKAPHPLQPIVRPYPRESRDWGQLHPFFRFFC